MELALGLVVLALMGLGGYAYGIVVGHRAGTRAGAVEATGRLLENAMIDGPEPYMGDVFADGDPGRY